MVDNASLIHFFVLAILQAGSSSEAILTSMSQELVPASLLALKKEKEQITLDGYVFTYKGAECQV